MAGILNKRRCLDRDGLIRHSALVFALTHLASVANLLFHVVMGHALSVEQYGTLASVLGLLLVCSMPMVAVQNTLAYFSGRWVPDRSAELKAMVRRWGVGLFLLGIGLLVPVFLFRTSLAGVLHLTDPMILVAAAASLPALLALPVLVGTLQGAQRFVWMSLAAHSWGVVRLLLVVGVLAVSSPLAIHGVMAHAAGLFVGLLLGAAGVARLVAGSGMVTGPTERGDVYFFRSLIVLLAFGILMYGDMVLVKHFFREAADYGSYARASTIARTIVFLPVPIAVAMFPKVVSGVAGGESQRGTLWKALALTACMILGAVALCNLFPGLCLLALYGDAEPTRHALALVRCASWAMAPLGLTFLLLNFELARNRFRCLPVVLFSALVFVGGAAVFHARLGQVIGLLGAAGLLSLVGVALGLGPRSPGTPRTRAAT